MDRIKLLAKEGLVHTINASQKHSFDKCKIEYEILVHEICSLDVELTNLQKKYKKILHRLFAKRKTLEKERERVEEIKEKIDELSKQNNSLVDVLCKEYDFQSRTSEESGNKYTDVYPYHRMQNGDYVRITAEGIDFRRGPILTDEEKMDVYLRSH